MGEKTKFTRTVGVKPAEPMQSSRIPADLEAKWPSIQDRLKHSAGTHNYNSYLGSLRLVSLVNGRLTLSSPSSFRRERVISQYMEQLRALCRQSDPSIRAIEIVVEPDKGPARAGAAYMKSPMPTRNVPIARPMIARTEGMKPSYSVLAGAAPNAALTFDNFVVGASNELACASARHVAMEPGKRYAALYLYSASGLGKTHLLNALANEAARLHPEMKIAYVPAGTFMHHYTQSAREGDTNQFRDEIRSVDMIILDDLQFICGRDKTVHEFIQTFNALQDAGKQVVIAADRPPSEIEGIDAHARSRLCGALAVTIMPPDFELRKAIIVRKLADMRASGRTIEISDSVIDFIAHKIDSNPRELGGALNRIANNSEISRAGTTLEMAQQLVHDLIRAPERRITIEDIQKKVASYYHVSMRDLLSHRRDRVIVRPRQVAMYLCKELTTRSLPEIGRRFGGRDHTTVLYGVRRIGQMKQENTTLADEIELLRRMLEN
jgi:chromosomal replication initiator protein